MFTLPIVDTWPNISSNKFKFKNCFFGAPNVVKISDKEKFVYSGYGITFDDAVSWSFDNDYARDVTIFELITVHHLIETILRIIF